VTGVGARNDRGQSIISVDIPAVQAYVAQLVTGTPPAPAPPLPSMPPDAPPGLTGSHLLRLNGTAAAYTVPCVD
jgi:hypothetical protein